MRKTILFSFFSLLSFLCWGQTEVIKNVGDFTTLRAFDKIPVTLIESSDPRVEISGNKSEDVQVINKNGELKIRMGTLNLLSGDNTSVKVYYSELNDIQTSEGALVKGTDEINSNQLSLNAKEGSTINIAINSNKLTVRINSGGVVNVSGSTVDQDVLITSGGKYIAKNLDSENAYISLNAGGNAIINASEFVDAKTRAGGSIDIYGGAEVTQKTLLGGTITVH